MKPSCFRRICSRPGFRISAAIAAILLLPGCANLFVAKHKVLVDSISAPGAVKPAGKSYRLVAKRSVVSATPVQIPVVKACVDAALAGQGMFEPPASTPPDYFIEVSYGRDSAPRADPAARETFLELSARTNPEMSPDKSTGPEEWDVKVSVLGLAGPIESAMPLLSAVAANYLASNTRIEMKVDVPQNSPMVESVRTTAIKTLEEKGQMAPAGPPKTPAGPAAVPAPAPGSVSGGTAASAGATAASGR
jgi:hypothetical protein